MQHKTDPYYQLSTCRTYTYIDLNWEELLSPEREIWEYVWGENNINFNVTLFLAFDICIALPLTMYEISNLIIMQHTKVEALFLAAHNHCLKE